MQIETGTFNFSRHSRQEPVKVFHPARKSSGADGMRGRHPYHLLVTGRILAIWPQGPEPNNTVSGDGFGRPLRSSVHINAIISR